MRAGPPALIGGLSTHRPPMLSLAELSVALVLACVVSLASCQGSCLPFTEAPLSQCGSVVEGSVFVEDGSSIASIDQALSEMTGPFRLGLTSKACSDAAMKFICSGGLPTCEADPLTVLPPCQSVCNEFVSECGAALQAQGQPVPTCDALPSTDCNDPSIVTPYREVPRATCEPIPDILSGSQCQGFVDYDVYVPEGLTLEALDALVGESTAPFRIGLVPGTCREAAMQFICAEGFRQCHFEEVAPGANVLLPSSTCRSTCEAFAAECGPVLAAIGMDSLVPVCDDTSETSGAPLYPEGPALLPLTPQVVANISCNAPAPVADYLFLPTATCERYNGTVWAQCNPVVDWEMVYVQEGQTQRLLDYTAYEQSRPFTYANVDRGCTAAMLRFVCSGVFLPCVTVPVPGLPGATIALPQPPCQRVCRELVVKCEETFERFGVTDMVPVCDAINPLSGQAVFPETLFVVPLGDQIVELPCTYPNQTIAVDRDCPGSFKTSESTDVEDQCEYPCPVPIYSNAEYLAMKITISINTVLTMIMSSLLIFTFALDRAKRRFPEGLPVWLGVSAFGFGLGFAFGVVVGFEPVICQSVFMCRAQATFLVYFQYGLAGWMTVIAFNMFLLFACKVPRKTARKLAPFYHIFAWGIGIPPMIVGLAIDRFTYIPPQLLCFISAEPDGWPQLGLYSFPIFVLCLLTVIFIFGLVLRIAMIAWQYQEKRFWRLMYTYWRIFLFIGLFLYVFSYNIEESIRAAITYDTNVKGFEDWAKCVFQNDGSDGCSFDTALHFAPSYVFAFNTSSQGWLVCLIFLTTPSSIHFWRSFPRRLLSLVTGKGFYGEDSAKSASTVTSQ
eukprot:TRINITY_DN6563_c0_g1_i1.p1 TRINITY_DN6563_c0_g1~~TRINITY_DN6563_c0_g1_i1.p1  ORF type:complete len:843 (+),score=184.71 TRINITY_DN6563_c0_g1_i1:129-2657(+)